MPGANKRAIKWLPRAARDLDDQFAYVAASNILAAAALIDKVEAAIDLLSDFPMNGRAGRVPGTREAAVVGTPLIMIYRLDKENLYVLRVLHAAQQWPPVSQVR